MRKILANVETIIIFTIIWVIFNEKADIITIFFGVFISVAAILFTNSYLLQSDYNHLYSFGLIQIVRYFIFLIFQIYKSGIGSIRFIFSKNPQVCIIEYKSCLKDDLAICMLANAITLTPGTVTIDKSDNILYILQFDDGKNNSINKTLKKFEDLLAGRKK